MAVLRGPDGELYGIQTSGAVRIAQTPDTPRAARPEQRSVARLALEHTAAFLCAYRNG